MTDLSIITVTYQSAAKIGAFLEAAHLAAPSAEIVVVDNASTDETCEVVQAADERVKLVRSTENLGFGRGCDLARRPHRAPGSCSPIQTSSSMRSRFPRALLGRALVSEQG